MSGPIYMCMYNCTWLASANHAQTSGTAIKVSWATNWCILVPSNKSVHIELVLLAKTPISNVLDKMRRRRPWWTNINLHKSDAASFCVIDFVPWMKMRIRSTYLCVFFYILFLLFYFFFAFFCVQKCTSGKSKKDVTAQ